MSDFGISKIHKEQLGSKSYEIPMGRWPTSSNQDTTTGGLPAGCVGHDIHLTGYRETNIIVLGEMFQPSYLPEIQIWLVSEYSRPIESRKKNESLQHKSTRWRCEILGKWTTIASSKTWAGSATNMWTRCPRQACPHGSLTIKHYRVLVGSHHRGYQNSFISPD